MIKIVLDTNIIVSALNFAGKPGKVFDLVVKEEVMNIISHDPDNRILECALAGRVDFIITGDKHLLDLGTFRGIEITTPAEFLDSFADLK